MTHRLLPTLLAAALAAPHAPAAAGETVERRVGAMGTVLAVEVEAADRVAALRASEDALRALEAVETRLSTWRSDTELARLNAAPVGVPFALSPALRSDLAAARRWHDATGGAFDPGVGALVELWDLRGAGRLPADLELAAARAGCGLARLTLDARGAVRTAPGLRIEEGAFGKGRGLDAALAALRAAGATRARLDLGGQVALLGDAPERVEVADPRARRRALVALHIAGGSLATTGNGERGLEVDGRRVGHVLDPRTGRPAPDFGSLTVWAADATAADCLSTGLYVLGPDAALRFARERQGVEVLVLEVHPDGRRVARASAGLRGRLEACAEDLPIQIAEPPAHDVADDGGERPVPHRETHRPPR